MLLHIPVIRADVGCVTYLDLACSLNGRASPFPRLGSIFTIFAQTCHGEIKEKEKERSTVCPSVDRIVAKPNTGTEQRSLSQRFCVAVSQCIYFAAVIPCETGESWGVSFSFSALAFFVAFGLVLCFRFFPAETVWPACCCLPFIPTLVISSRFQIFI